MTAKKDKKKIDMHGNIPELLDAYESMLFHELMNNMNFVAYPPETMSNDEIVKYSKYSGMQIVQFLAAIRLVKLYEINLLRAEPVHGDLYAVFREISKHYAVFFERRSLSLQISEPPTQSFAFFDYDMVNTVFFSWLGLLAKYADDKSVIMLGTGLDNQNLQLSVRVQNSSQMQFPFDAKAMSLVDCLLNREGFNRIVAIKWLLARYVMRLHNSVFELQAIDNTIVATFSFPTKLNRTEPVETFREIEIPDFRSCSQHCSEIIEAIHIIQSIPFYKISEINRAIDRLQGLLPESFDTKWKQTVKNMIDAGDEKAFFAYFEEIAAQFQS